MRLPGGTGTQESVDPAIVKTKGHLGRQALEVTVLWFGNYRRLGCKSEDRSVHWGCDGLSESAKAIVYR